MLPIRYCHNKYYDDHSPIKETCIIIPQFVYLANDRKQKYIYRQDKNISVRSELSLVRLRTAHPSTATLPTLTVRTRARSNNQISNQLGQLIGHIDFAL